MHFDELLNQPTAVDWDILDEVKQHPTIEEFDELITIEELNTAVKNIKLRKNPGPDGIIPKVLIFSVNALIVFLFTIFNLIQIMEDLPSDLINAIIDILFKKSDHSHCGNHCGIFLISVLGKIFLTFYCNAFSIQQNQFNLNLSEATEAAEVQLTGSLPCVK